ncbi:MAG TPA: cytochrome c oxidase assembly protein, partial [Methylophilaceae bacterium]|nr:cytochrome c oxidase assembly protein [Methylophilaceae bacterium]
MDAVDPAEQRRVANRRLGLKLLWLVAAAILFAVGMVPLYNVMCSVTGLNGKTANVAAAASNSVDTTRWVRVEFTGNVM